MAELVMDSEGRVTLPEDVRERLRLRPGDAVEVYPASRRDVAGIPPWAHGDPDWRAKADARIAAARAELVGRAPAEGPMSLDEARTILNNRSAWASRADGEDGVSYIQRLRDEWAARERRLSGHDNAR
jgi:AbrB family looped-hinge helix DNA binding protein